MGLRNEMEKALTIFKKPEIERVAPGQIAERRIEIVRPPSLAGLTGYVNQGPDDPIAGRIGTVRHYLPPDQQRVEFTRPGNVQAIATDQLEFPRVCSWSLEDWMATYAVRDHRLYWAGGIKLDEVRKEVQYAGHVHQTYRVDSSSFGIETCPCCGKTGNSAIYCQTCERQGRETFICWGFVYVKGNQRFTRCPVCRNEAALTTMNVSQTGIFPKVRMR